ncbi:hypothetical protein GF322_03695 [Candidatus Dependentiae bacterium]|nr:hypothetical protein [Candidatus Dependentiae bacterium]
MFIILKAMALFFAIIFVLPIVFLFLVGSFGDYFSLNISKDSWLANVNNKWVRSIINKFLI